MSRPRKSNRHLPKYVTEVHGSYWYKAPKAKAVRVCDKGDMQALYKFMADKSAPAGPVTTLSDCFDRYIREVVPTLAPRTQIDYIRHLGILRATFGHMGPDDVRPRDIGKFLDVPKGKIQRNRQVAVLSAVYTKMVGRWYVAERNPCIGQERNKSRKRDRYITDAEFEAVYAVMPPRMRLAMDLALLTGQRQRDLLDLTWDRVTPEGIAFQQGKTGKRLIVAISPALEEVLLRARKLLPDLPRRHVIRTKKGTPYTSEGFRAVWQRGMRRALNGKRTKKGLQPPVLTERFTFHDIRAKTVSDSKSLEDAMNRAGHQSMAMTRSVYDRGVRIVQPLK